MKKALHKLAAILLIVGSIAAMMVTASAEEVVQGCSVAPDGPDAISIGTVTMDASEEYIILAETTLHFTVQADVSALPSSERGMYARSANVDVPMVATVTVAQKSGTQKLTTSVTVRPENLLNTPLIRSFTVSLKYVNYTDFSIPDGGDGFTVRSSNPSNYLSGSHDSNQSFVKGHSIATTVTINSIVMDNATWSSGPVSTTQRVTIR